jgi:hypothetical protein
MIQKKIKLVDPSVDDNRYGGEKLTYWRSSPRCFSILYKGIITDICEGDIGYGDMDRMDGAIHAAIGCKQQKNKDCPLREV